MCLGWDSNLQLFRRSILGWFSILRHEPCWYTKESNWGWENCNSIPDFKNGEFQLKIWWCQDKNESYKNEEKKKSFYIFLLMFYLKLQSFWLPSSTSFTFFCPIFIIQYLILRMRKTDRLSKRTLNIFGINWCFFSLKTSRTVTFLFEYRVK